MRVFIVSGVLAFMNMIFFIIAGFRKTKKEIKFLHMCCSLCDFVMYLILGAKTGLANSVANICKSITYIKFDSMKFTICFGILRMILLFVGWEGIITGLFILCEITELIILKYGSAKQLLILTLLRQCVWVIYDVLFATMLVASFTIISFIGCLIGTIRK